MGIVINNNVTALNAWRNLSTSNTKLGKSLEKLSSGLQINRGADNPAGLVISEKLRAQITGLDQASKNAEDAVSVIQVGEGALTEVHSILNSIRALAVHSANAGANDSDSIAADQSQVDNAIDAISRIANTTKFLGKYLLNGGSANTATIADAAQVTAVTLGTAHAAGNLDFSVTTVGTQAKWTMAGVASSSAQADWSASYDEVWSSDGIYYGVTDTLTINGTNVTLTSGTTSYTVLNNYSATTGITASVETIVTATATADNNQVLTLTQNSYGSKYAITLSNQVSGGVFGAAGSPNSTAADNVTVVTTAEDQDIDEVGTDSTGTIGDNSTTTGAQSATGDGLMLIAGAANEWAGTTLYIKSSAATGNANTGQISVVKNELSFNIGANAVTNEFVTFGINDMRSTKLGSQGNGYLDNSTNGIKTGQGNALATNAAGAVRIIDDAISAVSNERSKLGAYQKNAIETMQNNLGATMENIQAAESRIRDLDMAREMMTFTKNQILIQAGTSMLAQANQIPQSALSLLR
jgi:flagellin